MFLQQHGGAVSFITEVALERFNLQMAFPDVTANVAHRKRDEIT